MAQSKRVPVQKYKYEVVNLPSNMAMDHINKWGEVGVRLVQIIEVPMTGASFALLETPLSKKGSKESARDRANPFWSLMDMGGWSLSHVWPGAWAIRDKKGKIVASGTTAEHALREGRREYVKLGAPKEPKKKKKSKK